MSISTRVALPIGRDLPCLMDFPEHFRIHARSVASAVKKLRKSLPKPRQTTKGTK
jgi:hypothetical protein